jgi:RND family efflux transporter MFP subunit
MKQFQHLSTLLSFFILLSAFGCRAKMEKPPIPTPEVVVETVLMRDVQPYIKTTGTTKAFQFVEIPARVSGYLREIRYTPGEIVLADAPLFLIQPEQYQAEFKAAESALASAHAQLKLMETNLERTSQLVATRAATQQDMDTDSAHREAALAAVTKAEADLETAKLNLGYTDVRSPITGKVDRNFIDIGNMVGPIGSSTVLTTVAGMDPIYVYFDISDSQFNDVRQYAREHKDQTNKALTIINGLETSPVAFEISLIKGSESETGEYPFKGIIDMAGNRIDASTGTMTVRGEIPNPDYEIYPGQICRVRIPVWPIHDAILIKQEAIGTDLNQRYVYVVDENNIVHRRSIELGSNQPDGTRVVVRGLERGERYIVSGIQKVRDGAKVKIAEPKAL